MGVVNQIRYWIDKFRYTWRKRGLFYTLVEGAKYAGRKTRSKIRRTILKTVPDRYWLRCIYWWNTYRLENSSTIDPFRKVTVDPAEIRYCSTHDGSIKWTNLGKVKGGDWDQLNELFTESNIYNLLKERYKKGRDWNDIQFIHDCLQNRIHWRRATTPTEIRDRCDHMDELYTSIQTDGYRANHELQNARRWERDAFDEIIVDIGRHGELLFVDGRHRLSIAKILELDTVPVQVSVRHKEWWSFRERVIDELESSTDMDGEFRLPHPGFQDISGERDGKDTADRIADDLTTRTIVQLRPDLGLRILAYLNRPEYDCIAVEPNETRREIIETFAEICEIDISITDSIPDMDERYSVFYDMDRVDEEFPASTGITTIDRIDNERRKTIGEMKFRTVVIKLVD